MTVRALKKYREKRNFQKTKEPAGGRAPKPQSARQFVIQQHNASRMHYDFRLESEGVLKSWAVPKGPSLDPDQKRLAVQVEDHPIEYGGFEGTIPEGEYGAGEVIVWDNGSWVPIIDPAAGFKKGHLQFELKGKKLKGLWNLVRLPKRPGERSTNWLLIKQRDKHAVALKEKDILVSKPRSVLSRKDRRFAKKDRR